MAEIEYGKCPDCGQENIGLTEKGKLRKNCHKCKKEKLIKNKWYWIPLIMAFLLVILAVIFMFVPVSSQELKAGAGILLIAEALLIISIFFVPEKEKTNYAMITLMIVTIGIMMLSLGYTKQSLDATTEALNLARADYNRTIELDQNIQESLFISLNIKLDASIANAIVFLDNNSRYIEESPFFFQTKFPGRFEQYIELLRISDEDTVIRLLALEQFTSRVNNAIDYTQNTWTTASEDINKQGFKKAVWSEEQKVIKYIYYYSCIVKKDLTEKYGRPFNQPDINSLVINEAGIVINPREKIC